MEIRIAEKKDIPDAAALEAACFSAGASRETLERMLDRPDWVLLCAAEGEELLGHVWFQTVLDEGYVGNIAVAPTHRRKGVGRALTLAMLERARERGAAFLTLEVREGNLPARRLYESCGFQRVAVRKNYYERPREDAVLMTAFFREED